MTGIQLTGFEMISKLGEGGMAAVWKARQISLDRTVAIKILSSRFASDSADILRFQQEAQSAAKLKHPGIVQVYDANIENGLYFFVMEFVDGYTCADWLIRKGVLAEQDVLLIAECVADALAYAWEREKMIHCDIKPDNIMIDEDGTVKVTDLGLSRTISGMSVDEESEEILGTPAYMAPEQAMGEANQDCRLDMYALGAMMYHLSTGKLLFEDCPEAEVMERQVNDTVVNPKDLNPSLSLGFCKLVEVLMAKEKEGRPAEWEDVRDAISRVKKGHYPKLQLPEGIVSTVRPSVVAEEAAATKAARLASHVSGTRTGPGSRGSLLPIVAGVALLLVIAAVAAKMIMGGDKPVVQPQVSTPPQTGSSGGEEVSPIDQEAKNLYYAASRWEKSHNASFDDAIVRYQEVISTAPASQYAERAKRDISRLEQTKKDNSAENALRGLEASAAPWLRQHQYDQAIKIYVSYNGPGAAETQIQRDAKVAEFRKMASDWAAAEKARLEAEVAQRFNALLDSVVGMVTRSDFAGAARMVQNASVANGLQSRDDALQDLIGSLEESANIDNVILDSFKGDKGKSLPVQFSTGVKTVLIGDVKDGLVRAEEVLVVGGARASVARNFGICDLSVAEKLRRMGSDSNPAVAIVKGVMAYQSNAFSHARRYFEGSHHLLMTRLLALLGGAATNAEADAGQADLAALLKSLGIDVGDEFIASVWSARVGEFSFTAPAAARAKQLAADFKIKHDNTAFCNQAGPILDALMNAEVAAAPAVQEAFVPAPVVDLPPQIASMVGNPDAVVDALLAANPELGSEAIDCKRDGEGRVRSIRIKSSDIADISAVAALRNLNSFEVKAHWRKPAQLSDLSPLAGLPLNSVIINSSKVSSVADLRGLPIKVLSITGCDLRDLTPLRGMSLESIDVSGTKVFDFSVLNQLPLREFAAAGTQIKHLSFLRNAQLVSLDVNDTGVFDFSVVSRMPLQELKVSHTQFKMLEMVKNCPIRRLEANGTGITDLASLKDLAGTLKVLLIDEVPVRNFSVLKSLDLKELSLESTAFSDMSLISHMKLTNLNIGGTKIMSLDGLDASAITVLNIERTGISSIALLRDTSIEELYCQGNKVRNFMPVYDSKVTRLSVDAPGEKWSIYGKMPALERVNGQYIHNNPQF